MSATPAHPIAPPWLSVPEDANALAAAVWPASARRDDEGHIRIGGVDAERLARQYGTPLYVLDEDEVRSRAAAFRAAFQAAAARHGATAHVYYAGKAFLSTEIVRWVVDEGLWVDVCSGGELEVALAAGADPAHIGFHGNNKSVAELTRALEVGVGTIIVDSLIEIERLADLAARAGVRQHVLVRVNSGVHAETHEFLATAHEDQKFGFTMDACVAAVERIRAADALVFDGVHCHIGSQIFGVAGFAESAARLVALIDRLRADGPVRTLNLGGGFGIAYTEVDRPSPIEELAAGIVAAVADECRGRGIPMPELAFEPGRSIVGPAGVTLYEVGTTKPVRVDDETGRAHRRLYVSVDGGMSDNARPALYGAQFCARLAGRRSEAEPALVRVVGKHCESGDIVVENDYLPGDVAPGDLLAVPATGAYCFSLASTYNYLPRPAVVAVRAGSARVIVRGETIHDLLARDVNAPTEGTA